jgi:hypothetical protein
MKYTAVRRKDRNGHNTFPLSQKGYGVILFTVLCLGAYLTWLLLSSIGLPRPRAVDDEVPPNSDGYTWQAKWNATRYLFVLYILKERC